MKILQICLLLFSALLATDACLAPPTPSPAVTKTEPSFVQDLRAQSGPIYLPEDDVVFNKFEVIFNHMFSGF